MDFDGRKRVVIENVSPCLECGRFPVKRVEGDFVKVSADIICDSQDVLGASVLYRKESQMEWDVVPMEVIANDRWIGSFHVVESGTYVFTFQAWVDHFQTWQRSLIKKFNANQDISVDLQKGIFLLKEVAKRLSTEIAGVLLERADRIESGMDSGQALLLFTDKEVSAVMKNNPVKEFSTIYHPSLTILVERKKALFSTWYEFFPRSAGMVDGVSGTFVDCERLLLYIASMGFDVLYFPPIHPVGITNRKGKNNSLKASEGDPGSPWAIGSVIGGHKDLEPQLGTLEAFIDLINAATSYGIEIAMDIAFQCSPDHPYIQKFPYWFKTRADGSIQYAENPPKRYEDIVPFDFENDQWIGLWEELKGIVVFWIEKGIRIFRIDNPHTKPFPFWAWLLREIRKNYPDTIFLSEAFTRPKVMYHLAKLGFSQSYTYFTWRNTKKELIDYFVELTNLPITDFFRPNLWPVTPDILPEYIQFGGVNACKIRLVLAATLSPSYGIYGPIFENGIKTAIEGKEEYADSEKYEIKHWDLKEGSPLGSLITSVNTIRKENPALQEFANLQFCQTDNDNLLCYVKKTSDLTNIIMVAVNLDPFHIQSGVVTVPISGLGIGGTEVYLLYDLLSDERFVWSGEGNHLTIDPSKRPAYILSVQTGIERESSYDYY